MIESRHVGKRLRTAQQNQKARAQTGSITALEKQLVCAAHFTKEPRCSKTCAAASQKGSDDKAPLKTQQLSP